MASVRKRSWTAPNGAKKAAYVVDYKDLGGTRRTPQFEKKHEAEAFKRKVDRELFDGTHTPGSKALLFRELAEDYLRDCDRRRRIGDKMSGNTWRLEQRLVGGHLVPSLGAKKASEITSKDVREFVNAKSEKYGRTTVIKLVSALRGVLQFGVQGGILRRNIVRDDPPRIPLPIGPRREIPNLADLKRLIETVEGVVHGPIYTLPGMRRRMSGDGLLYAAVATYLALTGGLRIGEICGLQWENVDFDAGVIRVRHSLSRVDGLKGPKSAAGVRDVPMAAVTRGYLAKAWQRQGQPADGYVMRTIAGTAYDVGGLGQNLWKPIALAAALLKKDGKPMGIHSIRHAAASLWIRAGVSDLTLKRAIGHSSIGTTKDVYGHLFEDDERDTARMLGSMLMLSGPKSEGST